MDTVTQAVFGAVVGQVGFQSKLGWRALAAGAALATVPDLDVFGSLSDPFSEWVHHRGGSPEAPLWETLVPEAFQLIKEPMLVAVRNQVDLTERAISRRRASGVADRRALLDILSDPELSDIFGGIFG